MRIVGGKFGGRKLQAPGGGTTRPTAERVREALFNILGSSVHGCRVIDVYAGSGALGIEALSRGAQSVVFIEKARSAAETLRGNLRSMGITDSKVAQVLQRGIEQSFSVLQGMPSFDLCLIDPPFAMVRDQTAVQAIQALRRANIMSPEGLVVLEYPSDQPCPQIKGLHPEQVRPYGDTHLVFFRVCEDKASEPSAQEPEPTAQP